MRFDVLLSEVLQTVPCLNDRYQVNTLAELIEELAQDELIFQISVPQSLVHREGRSTGSIVALYSIGHGYCLLFEQDFWNGGSIVYSLYTVSESKKLLEESLFQKLGTVEERKLIRMFFATFSDADFEVKAVFDFNKRVEGGFVGKKLEDTIQ